MSETVKTQAARDVLAERERQQSIEGWKPEHDDAHSAGELSRAAMSYLYAVSQRRADFTEDSIKRSGFDWPWDKSWWKPKNNRRDLVRAGALILAEIERIDRQQQEPTND